MINWRRLSIPGSMLVILSCLFVAFTRTNLLWDGVAMMIFAVGNLLIWIDEREI